MEYRKGIQQTRSRRLSRAQKSTHPRPDFVAVGHQPYLRHGMIRQRSLVAMYSVHPAKKPLNELLPIQRNDSRRFCRAIGRGGEITGLRSPKWLSSLPCARHEHILQSATLPAQFQTSNDKSNNSYTAPKHIARMMMPTCCEPRLQQDPAVDGVRVVALAMIGTYVSTRQGDTMRKSRARDRTSQTCTSTRRRPDDQKRWQRCGAKVPLKPPRPTTQEL